MEILFWKRLCSPPQTWQRGLWWRWKFLTLPGLWQRDGSEESFVCCWRPVPFVLPSREKVTIITVSFPLPCWDIYVEHLSQSYFCCAPLLYVLCESMSCSCPKCQQFFFNSFIVVVVFIFVFSCHFEIRPHQPEFLF